MNRLLVSASLLMTLFLAPTPPAAAACPDVTLMCSFGSEVHSEPAGSMTCATGSVSYDIPNAHLELAHAPYDPLYENRQIYAYVSDEYTVIGPGPVTSYVLRLRVRVHVLGYAASGAVNNATLSLNLYPDAVGPSASRHWTTYSGTTDVVDSLTLTIPRTGGDPIALTIDAAATANYDGTISSTLDYEFVDLPPGWEVISCNGYHQGAPVAAQARSWGSVKATYR